MPHSLPHFYGDLIKVKAVENANEGVAMKDLLKAALLLGGMLTLILIARVTAFVPMHSEANAAQDPAPIATSDSGCAVRQVKMPCFRHANPESRAMAPVRRESGPKDVETILSQDIRCAMQQVKFPCLQHTDWRS
jgi:hypothetical protein